MEYFKIHEFDSPDLVGSGKNMQKKTLELLDNARRCAGFPFVITSGYRTAKHNKEVDGVDGSSHTRGYAVDISCRASTKRWAIIKALLGAGFTRIGIAKTFIHADNDPKKVPSVIWVY